MRKYILALVILVTSLGYAQAHHAHRHRHHIARGDHHGIYKCAGCVLRDTLAGTVAVSRANGERLVSAINALWRAGFRGPVHCAAPYGTHVRHSLHHTGDACDMAQTGRNRTTARIMYHASAILARFGVNDGCSFRDCGHISVGAREAFASRRHTHYASR